ncbi:sigma 54 modulation/S30EA ribosomal C-terminal domain-containing protein [Nocardia sp. NPDC056611]|uniref:sigma 54 modulation/S30EA ribosomal C-terminal domain-containing protein n=1 Tax=Nocardia sp. NPDC056611 TaxID=3345877 RepID=UPI00366B0981
MLRASEAWTSMAFPDVVVVARGRVPVLEGERYAGAVGRQLRRMRAEDGARLRITGPNCDIGPYLAQVNLSVDGIPVRVQTLTHGAGDALPVVVRLERRILALRTAWRPRTWPDPDHRPLDAPGPGVIARRKSASLQTLSPSHAAMMMDRMDYDAHVFTDIETGEDAVVYRAGPSGLRLTRQRSVHPPRVDGDVARPFVVNPRPAPTLTEIAAVQRVCESGWPFLFFVDPATGRGRLLYRRYDGDLGLVTADGG